MKVFATLLMIFLCVICHGQIIVLSDKISKIDIDDKVFVFEDEQSNLGIKEILSKTSQFKLNKTGSPVYNKGFLWIKIDLQNISRKLFYLKSSNTAIGDIEVFKIDTSGYLSSVKTGILFPYSTREIDNTQFVFEITNCKYVYLKVKVTMEGANVIPLAIYDEKALADEINNINLLNGIYIGALILIIIFCIFNFSYLRDTVYLTYLLFIFSNLVLIIFGNGNLTRYFLQNCLELTNYPLAITMWASVFYHLFMMDFLQLKKYKPEVMIVNYILIGMTFLLIIGDLFNTNLIVFAPLIILINHIFSLTMSVIILKQGYKPAVFYMVGNIFVFFGTFSIFGLIFGLLPSNILTVNGLQICLLFEMIFFTLGLANKTYQLKIENDEAWEYFAHSLEENQNILINQKESLERQVQDRTLEIEAQNEELLQQQEELNYLNESLNHQKETIEEQNEELMSNNELLEVKVIERTNELIQSNERLIKQNKLLEQYSYITSHNLRGPIARILGLNNVLDIIDPSNPMNKEILGHLNQTTLALDAVVKDLSIVLNINYNNDSIREVVVFEDLIKNIKDITDTEDISIQTNFTEVVSTNSIKPYLHSIFYNLISNAIKYRSKNRESIVKITSSTNEDGNMRLVFEDNGVGMDLELIGDRIFKAFERFHNETEIDGKGIGLFLVNLHVENLEGKLEIESQLEKGTTFIITLPKS